MRDTSFQAVATTLAKATPLARNIARAHGVELETLQGSGPHGRIRAADVRASLGTNATSAAERPHEPRQDRLAVAPVEPTTLPLEPVEAKVASGLPIATATLEFDAGPALAWLAKAEPEFARLRLPLGLETCVVEAAAALLPAHPLLNGRWNDDMLLLRRRVHVAIAMPGHDNRLRWVVVGNAGDLTRRGIARGISSGGAAEAPTFAVVSLAGGASWQSAPPPLLGTSAALTVGAPVHKVVVRNGGVAARPIATLTVAYDARVLEHCHAAAFLVALRSALEQG